MNYYPNYTPALHQEQLYREMHRALARETGFDGVMRIRTCPGLTVRPGDCMGTANDHL